MGDHAFIGSATNIVAPVTIGDHAVTAAGSTITEDVPSEDLAIARARQVNKEAMLKVTLYEGLISNKKNALLLKQERSFKD